MSTEGKRNFRPTIHFTPEKGWMNDPNGMVYVDGVYHLSYQKHPYSTNWGPMHWGHAVSKDLLHWEHRPMILYPDELGYVFSGSIVYDKQNSSQYGSNEYPPLVAVYTSHDSRTGVERQSIAYSIDGGEHYEKSYLNPVIPNPDIPDFRDPKVFWNPVKHCWSMVLAAQDRVYFYMSDDLKSWSKTGEFGPEGNYAPGVWECPDMFPVRYDGKMIWVLIVSMTKSTKGKHCRMQYFLGDFDGDKFVCAYPAGVPLWLDEGFDNYAAVTYQNYEKPLLMGWALNWEYAASVPTGDYCGQATLARKLRIEKTRDGLRLAGIPAGLERYQHQAYPIENGASLYTETFGIRMKGTGDAKIVLRNSMGQKLKLQVEGDRIRVDRSLAGCREFHEQFMTKYFSVVEAERKKSGDWEMEAVFDVSILELFADQGLECFTMTVYPDTPYDRISWEGDVHVELYEVNI